MHKTGGQIYQQISPSFYCKLHNGQLNPGWDYKKSKILIFLLKLNYQFLLFSNTDKKTDLNLFITLHFPVIIMWSAWAVYFGTFTITSHPRYHLMVVFQACNQFILCIKTISLHNHLMVIFQACNQFILCIKTISVGTNCKGLPQTCMTCMVLFTFFPLVDRPLSFKRARSRSTVSPWNSSDLRLVDPSIMTTNLNLS